MKTCAYVRVSTAQQDVNVQKLTILEFAQREGFSIDRFIDTVISSRKRAQKEQLTEFIAELEAGDQIIVSELSRLGRSLGQIIQIADLLVKKEVKLVCIKENIRLDGKKDMQTKVMIALCGLFAEVERDLISERTIEGLTKAREQGRLPGRPKGSLGKSKLDGKEREIAELLNKGVSKSSIARITGVSRTALFNFVQTRQLEAMPKE
ncbi:DNA-invertase hin [invertebrate metagenome]|uniref:DNA-invertase hin n=1 Tax=invertebrate metagenome TaxID=1711999 RepID=A0A2H9T3E5_9ZZZZ